MKIASLTLPFLLIFMACGAKAKEGAAIPFHLNQDTQGPKLSPDQLSHKVESEIFDLTNQSRQNKKLASLASNETLEKIARAPANPMIPKAW